MPWLLFGVAVFNRGITIKGRTDGLTFIRLPDWLASFLMMAKVKQTKDKDLIEAAQADQKAFALLYDKYAKKVFNYFWYRLNHDTDTAEDLMQEVFLRALTHLAKFKEHSFSYLTYLLTIAHNLLIDYYKKPKSLSLDSLPSDLVSEAPVEVFSKLEKKDEAKQLWQAVQNLPLHERDVLLLHYHKGLKLAEIAKIKGKNQAAIKSLLARARKRLKTECFNSRVEDLAKFPHKKIRNRKPKFLFWVKFDTLVRLGRLIKYKRRLASNNWI